MQASEINYCKDIAVLIYCRNNINKHGVYQMTNPSDTPEFWEGIKADFISRQKDVDALNVKEVEALNDLRTSTCGLAESVFYFLDLEYDDLAMFMRSSKVLSEQFNWDPFESGSEHKRAIAEQSGKLVSIIYDHDGRLTLQQAKGFAWVENLVSTYINCKPNKYQMKRFEEFGITWEGDVRDH
jgi:hypothetical protein